MANPEAATRYDPYGEMSHVKATNLSDAARLVREATDAQKLAVTKVLEAKRVVSAMEAEKTAADTKLTEALHCLHLSALAGCVFDGKRLPHTPGMPHVLPC